MKKAKQQGKTKIVLKEGERIFIRENYEKRIIEVVYEKHFPLEPKYHSVDCSEDCEICGRYRQKEIVVLEIPMVKISNKKKLQVIESLVRDKLGGVVARTMEKKIWEKFGAVLSPKNYDKIAGILTAL